MVTSDPVDANVDIFEGARVGYRADQAIGSVDAAARSD